MDNPINASLINIETLYTELIGFIYHLAKRFQSYDMMNFDDLVGELNLEMVKGYQYYCNKITDLEQFKAVLRQMLAFRISELRHKQFGTHRVKAQLNISIELDIIGDDDYPDMSETITDTSCEHPEALYESMELVKDVRRNISPTAQEVMDAVCCGNDKLAMLAFLSTLRACSCKPNTHNRIYRWQMAEVLNISGPRIYEAFVEIRKALASVDNS